MSFNHYPDMDHDGDHDFKDSGMFHDMMDEENHKSSSSSVGCAPLFIMGIISIILIFTIVI